MYNSQKGLTMARKIIYLLLIVLIFLTGCKKEEEKEYTSMDVAGAIADISSDEDGNVLIKLVDGRMFTLGNLKGEKGEQGEKGDQGERGEPGKNGLNGKNGADGKDSYGELKIELSPSDINVDSIGKIDADIVIDKSKEIITEIKNGINH